MIHHPGSKKSPKPYLNCAAVASTMPHLQATGKSPKGKREVVLGLEPRLPEDSMLCIKIRSDNHYTTQPQGLV